MIDLVIIGFACMSLIVTAVDAKKEKNNNYIQCETDSCEEPEK